MKQQEKPGKKARQEGGKVQPCRGAPVHLMVVATPTSSTVSVAHTTFLPLDDDRMHGMLITIITRVGQAGHRGHPNCPQSCHHVQRLSRASILVGFCQDFCNSADPEKASNPLPGQVG